MGHYRPRRPKLNEDPMKPVEALYRTVDIVQKGKFREFSKWTPGVPTPEEHARRRTGRLRALNHGVKPRVGISVNAARNHSRYINAMVKRIENLNSTMARSKDFANANMHPVLLRRLVRKERKEKAEAEQIEQTPKKKKKKKQWIDKTAVDWSRTPPRDQPLKELASTQYPKAIRKHRPGEIVTREGTPYCYTPKPQSKLIDGTHLCDRYDYHDSESRKKYFSAGNIDRVKTDYKEVISNPQGLTTLMTKPWKTPPPPVSTYDPERRIDMRLLDLPSDLQATPNWHTPNWHTLNDPLRPSSSRKISYDVFAQPDESYEKRSPMPMPSHTPRFAVAGKPIMKDSCTTPTRPGCSSSNHVHLADLKQKTADPIGGVSHRFGEIFTSLALEPPLRSPHGHRTPESRGHHRDSICCLTFSTRPESPVNSKPEFPISRGSETPLSATLQYPGSIDYKHPDLEEGEIPAKYRPRDERFLIWPCCSTSDWG